MKRIPLHGRGGIRAYAVVDDEDFEHLSAFRWHLHRHGYAVTGPATLKMHRVVLGLVPGDGVSCDHINRDRLDNRRANLRVVTASENNQNQTSAAGSSSGFRGVSFHRWTGRWRATVRVGGKQHHLGLFDEELEAARAAARFRSQHMPFSVEDPALLEDAA